MSTMFISLFGWMPPVLQVVCTGVVILFCLSTILHIIRLVWDVLPFL